jgi:hypothetical protein
MFTVTIRESNLQTGSFVSGVERFDDVLDARRYFVGYECEQNLHVTLEHNLNGGRDVTIAEVDQDGRLWHLLSGRWVEDTDGEFRRSTFTQIVERNKAAEAAERYNV